MGLLKELREKQAAGTITDEEVKQLQAIEADIKADGDDSDDEKAIEDLATKLADKANSQVDEKLNRMEAIISKLSETPEVKVTQTGSDKTIVDAEMGEVSVKKLEETTVEVADRKQRGKQNVMISKKSIHFVQALIQQDRQKLQILTEGTAANGGYLVPDEFANMIVEDRRDATIMRQLATVIPVSTDSFHLPTLASRPKTFWRAEAAVKNTSTATFGEVVLTPYSLASIVPFLTNWLQMQVLVQVALS